MARGYDKHQARKHAVAGLGRELARRAKNRCELCGARESLSVIEVEPVYDEPDPERAVMVCARCAKAVEGGRHGPSADELRFLTESVWSETLPAQLAAVRVVRRLSEEGASWATETLEGLYLDEAVEALV